MFIELCVTYSIFLFVGILLVLVVGFVVFPLFVGSLVLLVSSSSPSLLFSFSLALSLPLSFLLLPLPLHQHRLVQVTQETETPGEVT